MTLWFEEGGRVPQGHGSVVGFWVEDMGVNGVVRARRRLRRGHDAQTRGADRGPHVSVEEVREAGG